MRSDHHLRSRRPQRPRSPRRFIGPGDPRRGVRAGRGPRRERAQRRLERVADTRPFGDPPGRGLSFTEQHGQRIAVDRFALPVRHRHHRTPSPSPSATPVPTELADVAIVPVTNFRSGQAKVGFADIDLLEHGTGPYKALTLVASDADAILPPSTPTGRPSATGSRPSRTRRRWRSDLAKHRDRLAFLRVGDVTPAVRALGWGARELFGVAHADPAQWPLSARLAVAQGATPDASPVWTLVAGGDILLDRGVSLAIGAKGRNFVFDGHEAEIMTRYCCSSFGWELPRTRRVAARTRCATTSSRPI